MEEEIKLTARVIQLTDSVIQLDDSSCCGKVVSLDLSSVDSFASLLAL